MSKAKAQRRHAKRRAAERLGVELTNGELTAMVKKIQSGKAKMLERSSGRVTIWAFEVAGQPVRAVYDKDRHTIVTFIKVRS